MIRTCSTCPLKPVISSCGCRALPSAGVALIVYGLPAADDRLDERGAKGWRWQRSNTDPLDWITASIAVSPSPCPFVGSSDVTFVIVMVGGTPAGSVRPTMLTDTIR